MIRKEVYTAAGAVGFYHEDRNQERGGSAYEQWQETVERMKYSRPQNLSSREREKLNKQLELEEFFEKAEYRRRNF